MSTVHVARSRVESTRSARSKGGEAGTGPAEVECGSQRGTYEGLVEGGGSATGSGGSAGHVGRFPEGTADHLEFAGKWGGNEGDQLAHRR